MSRTGGSVAANPSKNGGLRDVGGRLVPGVAVTGGDRQGAPAMVALEDHGVRGPEHLGIDRLGDDGTDLLRARPQVGEEHGRAGPVAAERLAGQVDVDAAGEGEGHDERWGREVARAGQRMDAPLEVAVARQHGGDHEVVLLDGLRDRLVERTAVADAGRAAVAGERESKRPPAAP